MRRRDFLRCVGAASGYLGLARAAAPAGQGLEPGPKPTPPPERPLDIGLGPQLFLDDYLVERLDGLSREVQSPQRFARPVLDSQTFGTTQPYLTVLHDPEQKQFRIWYNRGSAIGHAESADGIHWGRATVAWDLRRNYGASLVDDGARAPDPARRYKLASWQQTPGTKGTPSDNGGMHVGFSPDGLHWTAYAHNPVLPTWPEGAGKFTRHSIGDIVDVYYDPLNRRYAAAVKVHALAEDGYAPGPRAGNAFRRLVGLSTSADFVQWEKPRRILVPDAKDEGLLEFYGMGGMHVRGSLHIGLVRVLRDDLACDPGGPRNGIGYTVLATSRDGLAWQRYREPFLDRNPEAGSWDHAMAWMSGVVPVGEELFFYYGGYARGHKVAADRERQIGLARLRQDRYVALVPTRAEGTLRTRLFWLRGERLTVNARAQRGEVRVRLLDGNGQPLVGPGAVEARPITEDVLAGRVAWSRPLRALQDQPVRLEFRVRQAALFGFGLHLG